MSQEMIESPVSQSIDNAVLDVERLRHSDEHVSGIWLWILGIPILLFAAYTSIISMGLYPAALFLIARITQLMALAYLKTNSIRVGPISSLRSTKRRPACLRDSALRSRRSTSCKKTCSTPSSLA